MSRKIVDRLAHDLESEVVAKAIDKMDWDSPMSRKIRQVAYALSDAYKKEIERLLAAEREKVSAGFSMKVLDERDKRVRAKVLSACLGDIDEALSIYMEHKGRSKDDKTLIGGVCLGIKNRLEQLDLTKLDEGKV